MMVPMKFSKYEGAGNDFIITNAFTEDCYDLAGKKEVIIKLCDRNFGIGSDGLIVIKRHKSCSFEMQFYNTDGLPAALCGNGSRCAVRYVYDHKIVDSRQVTFMAYDGMHHGTVNDQDVTITFRDIQEVKRYSEDEYFIHTGAPHHVVFVETLDFDIMQRALPIHDGDTYKDVPPTGGTNVMFVLKNKDAEGNYKARSFERGGRCETLACGTGGIAVGAAIAVRENAVSGCYEYPIKFPGGLLTVKMYVESRSTFRAVCLTGPANKVFEGTIYI